jgi:hypothetical protein
VAEDIKKPSCLEVDTRAFREVAVLTRGREGRTTLVVIAVWGLWA